MKARTALAALAITSAACATVRGDVVFGNFESGTSTGFGALTASSGVQPWASQPQPLAGTVVTAAQGPLTGSKVLELTGNTGFNFGYSGAAALGFDFRSQGLQPAVLANDQLEFDWYPLPNGGSAGYSQLYNVVLNSQGGGWAPVDGYGGGNNNFNQFYYTGYTGIMHHLAINYAAYNTLVAGGDNPDGGNWFELAIQTNAGGGAPADYYLDNFRLSSSSNPTNAQWNVNADGTWAVDTNWTPGAPDAAGAIANFGSAINAPHTVTLDSVQVAGQLNFNSANKYTIGGSSMLTLVSTIGTVGITVTTGSHDITAPLALAKDTTFTVTPAGSTLKIANLQDSTVNITTAGAGVSELNRVRANSLSVNSGTTRITAGRSTGSTSSVTALTIAGGATPTARLDLGNNDLAVDYSGSSPLTTIAAQIKAGYNGNTWTGNGITSSAAAASLASGHPTALGYGEASQILGASGGAFSGLTVDGTAVLVRYTYAGDANLSGSVDSIDFNILASNFAQSGKSWTDGDSDYSGTVDSIDFNLLVSNFAQPTIAAPALGGLVPEPQACFLLAAVAGLLRRRKEMVRA